MPDKTNNERYFVLHDGRKVNFFPGYYDFHVKNYGHKKSVVHVSETSINAAGGSKNVNYENISKKFSKQNSSIKLSGFVSKVVPTYQMIELFKDTRFEVPNGKVLDLGCGLGFHLRLLKAWGYIKEAVGIDIYDICSGFDVKKIYKLQSRFKLLKYIEGIQDRLARKDPKKLSMIEQAILSKIPTVRNFSRNYGHRPSIEIYNQSFKNKPSIDRLIIGDVYDLEEKFDLITSFASLDWFTAKEIIPKVYDLLEEGGFFYVWVTNWWQSVNTSNLFGHFPFAAQRMTKEEYFNYSEKAMPEHVEDIKKAYGYFDPSYPTLADYIEIANDVGLVPLTWKENTLPDILRGGNVLSSLGVSELDSKEFQNAWMDIKCNRPDIRKRDLYPYSMAILFYKPPHTDKIDEALLNSLKTPEFHYRPKGIFGKALKSIAEKFFLP